MSNVSKNYVNVVFCRSPYKEFTYKVPEQFRHDLTLGHRVLVPLGNRKTTGFVVHFVEKTDIKGLKEIEDILDSYPLLNSEMIRLTQWIAIYYMAYWGEVIRAALPPGLHRQTQCMIHISKQSNPSTVALAASEQKILEILRSKKRISLSLLQRYFGKRDIRFVLSKLEKLGLVCIEQILENQKVKNQSEIRISIDQEVDSGVIEGLMKRAPKQASVLLKLMDQGGEAKRSDLNIQLSVLRRLKEKGYIKLQEVEIYRDPYASIPIKKTQSITLTVDQQRILNQIKNSIHHNKFHVFLLFGVTASGKTQVYIQSIREVLSLGKTALVLVPEISLTPQAVQRYRCVFGGDVAVLHSRLSAGERYDAWRKIREGKIRIALGPRSAVFAPLQNLGLVVVDEEHEASYKQMDPSPRYHARDMAVIRGKFNDCVVILGSATPSVESYYNAQNGKYTLCELPHRIDRIPMPKVHLVKMHQLQKKGPNILSPLLLEKMDERFRKGEQVILLQNRRGFAPFLRCGECGHIERCIHCDISLTYHQDCQLRCHHCGYQKPADDICSLCGGSTLVYRGIGTQRVEQEVRKNFHKIRFFRMDADTTRQKGAHDKIVYDFEQGEADVLLGTQMVAKGHDFPKVTLVGIISADTGIHFPDFRAGERVFQLLTQAAGRSGRRDFQGEVVLQTMYPDHPIIAFVIKQDYTGFYTYSLEQRRELHYPPIGRIVIVRFKSIEQTAAVKASEKFSQYVKKSSFFESLGPLCAPLSKIKGWYRYHLVFRCKRRSDPSGNKIRMVIQNALQRYYESSPLPNIRIGIDVDPVDMM